MAALYSSGLSKLGHLCRLQTVESVDIVADVSDQAVADNIIKESS
jgi:hypothetical protein